jgi:ribosome recycling factor
VEDARTLTVTAWDKSVVPDIEKAIMKSDLGLNPATAGEVIRIPMPALTEETRKGFIRQARHEAEAARVSVRNARRDAIGMLKELLKEKDISEDEDHRAQDDIQKLTDRFVAEIEKLLAGKESDLLEI